MRSDRGSTAADLLGVVVVVAVIVGILSTSALGDHLLRSVRAVVCQIAGRACAAGDAPPGQPDGPCVTGIDARTGTADVGLTVVDVGGGLGYLLQERSDGTVAVTAIDLAELGASAGVGGGFQIRIGDQRIGALLGAGGGVSGEIRAGDTVILPDRDAADDYVEDLLVDQATDVLPGPLGGLADGALDIVGIGDNNPEQEHESTSAQVGITVEGAVRGVGGVASGEIEASLNAAGRVTRFDDGRLQASFILAPEVAASLGIPGVEDVQGGSAGRVTASLTIGPDGELAALDVQIQHTVVADLERLEDIDDVDELLDGVAASVTDGVEGRRSVVDLHLDLRSGRAAEAAAAFVASLAPGGAPTSDAAAGLADVLREEATASHLLYDVDVGNYGAEASAEVVGEVGLGVNLEVLDADLVGASYYDPIAGRFVPWTACEAGIR